MPARRLGGRVLAAEPADLDFRRKERTSYYQLSSELQGAAPPKLKMETTL